MKVYESIYWDKGESIRYGRVLRDYDAFPDNSGGNTAFYSAIASGSLPIVDRAGPAWLSTNVTYLQSAAVLQIEVTASVGVQLKIARLDGQGLTGSDLEGNGRSSGVFYDFSTVSNIKQWTFGKTSSGTGGVPAVPLSATFRNVATSETYTHLFTPIDRASKSLLFGIAGTTTPVTPTNPGTATTQQIVAGNPDVLKPKVEWAGGLARIVNEASPSVGSNEDLYVWIGGHGAMNALPTGYTFGPGDMVGLMIAVVTKGTNPNYGGTAWTKKGWANVLIGPAPTN